MVKFHCHNCPYTQKWYSQPQVGNTKAPAGNLELSAAISFTGINAEKALRMLEIAGIQGITKSTYHEYRKNVLEPTIQECWDEQQKELFRQAKNRGGGLVLGGDGRADSPGHCAKYGTYTTMDLQMNKVLHVEVVQV